MAMKKKFLGLAMAAAMVLPASSAYATSKTHIFNQDATQAHQVEVSGTITKKDGTAPAGKIQVELPTAMSFLVNEKGEFSGCDFEVKNQSDVGIDVLVQDFKKSTGNITLKEKNTIQSSDDRSNVSLVLKGRDENGTELTADLAEISTTATETEILNVQSKQSGFIKLTGEAGKANHTASGQNNDVDANGAQGQFTLVFKIKKDK